MPEHALRSVCLRSYPYDSRHLVIMQIAPTYSRSRRWLHG